MRKRGRIITAFESGQALVLVLLSMAVVLTVVLFIISRTITDVNMSSATDESVRAFSAAEAGVEKALVIGSTNSSTSATIGNASYAVTVSDYASEATSFNFPDPISEGDYATVWFMNHDASGNLICDFSHPCFTGNSLQVCWGNPGTSQGSLTTPAVEVSVYYESRPGDLSTIRVARAALDPNSTRTNNNYFSTPTGGSCTISGVSYPFSSTINFSSLNYANYNINTSGLVMAKIRMLYNFDTAQQLGISVPGGTLPSQGKLISSEGTAGSSNRKINVFQGWAEFPFFPSAIFVPSGITQ